MPDVAEVPLEPAVPDVPVVPAVPDVPDTATPICLMFVIIEGASGTESLAGTAVICT